MASVFIGDLDDFITPSQACVNPIFAGTAEATPKAKGADAGDGDSKGRAKVTLEASWMEDAAPMAVQAPALVPMPQQEPDLIKARPAGQGGQGAPAAATVSLNDCLACRYVSWVGGRNQLGGTGDGVCGPPQDLWRGSRFVAESRLTDTNATPPSTAAASPRRRPSSSRSRAARSSAASWPGRPRSTRTSKPWRSR